MLPGGAGDIYFMTESRGKERDKPFQTDHLTPVKYIGRMCSFLFLVATAAGMYSKHRKAFCLEALPHLQGFWEHQSPGPAALGIAGTISPMNWSSDAVSS